MYTEQGIKKNVAGIINIPKRCKKICISMSVYIIYIATYANIYI